MTGRKHPSICVTLSAKSLRVVDETRERLGESRSRRLDAIIREWSEEQEKKHDNTRSA